MVRATPDQPVGNAELEIDGYFGLVLPNIGNPLCTSFFEYQSVRPSAASNAGQS